MPWTAKQRALFHAKAEGGEPGFSKLAKEADAYAKAGEELPPKHDEKRPGLLHEYVNRSRKGR
jgi:hypothetical protein